MRLLTLFIIAASVSTSVALAQPNIAPPVVDPTQQAPVPRVPRPGTSKEQIGLDFNQLFAALNALSSDPGEAMGNFYTVPSFVSGGRAGFFGVSEWIVAFAAERRNTRFRLDQIDFLSLENDAARVKVTYSLLVPNNVVPVAGQPAGPAIIAVSQAETLDLRLEIVPWDKTRKWRIVPPSFDKLPGSNLLSLGHIAYFGSQRAGTLSQLRAEISVNQLKQIGLGTMQFVQDYDEQYLFQNDFWRDALKPYVRSDSIFLIPGTQNFYTFNDNLSDKSLIGMKHGEQTVLFYEGRDEEPIFRYDGKAAICFVDGHVKLINRAEEQALLWKPQAG